MSNVIAVTGRVCDNIKRFDNDDGSLKLIFAVASRTQDPKRWDKKTEKDFWNCEVFIPASRSNFADHITPGKIMSVAGIPYKRFSEDKKEFTNIRVFVDMMQFVGPKEDSSKKESESGPESKKTNNPPQQHRSHQGGGESYVNQNSGSNWTQ